MARYEHLEIYRESYELCDLLFGLVTKFDRNWKYHLGERLVHTSIDIVSIIAEINSIPITDRSPLFIKLSRDIVHIALFLRIAENHKLFRNRESYFHLIEHLSAIRKMSEGWRRSGGGRV